LVKIRENGVISIEIREIEKYSDAKNNKKLNQ